MPGWIWIILVVFMLIMIVGGAAYAFFKGLHTVRGLSTLGAHAQKDMAAMQTEPQPRTQRNPAFTQPLEDTAKAYEDAHLKRREYKAARRNRHVATWRRWEAFNTKREDGIR
ncbi:MAG: hypothetical protein LKJ47_05060 [Bifidobacteriaceae bacterium]|jgi:Trk-type K+ transport system membrane component|nr:hypothetical protein [Bifidobacteriaceae bacterium]